MSAHPWAPDDPEREPWDAVVIGAGMGGGTAGFELAARGRRVLLLERGKFLQRDPDTLQGLLADPIEDPEERLRRGRWPFPLEGRTSYREMNFYAPLGCGTGGSSALYAARLERFFPSDFEPRRHHAHAGGSALPEAWPFSYEELEPYYERAEELFRVHGTPDPLRPPPRRALPALPPMSEQDGALAALFERSGLHPYRAHVGCAFEPGCNGCGGVVCLRACKADAGTVCVVPAVEKHGAKLLPECEVLRLESGPNGVERALCRWRGRDLAIRARIFVLAAGTFSTPRLLLESGGLANRSDQVGRNLMLHTSDYIAVRPDGHFGDGIANSLTLNDFYVVGGEKLGAFQSVGIPVAPGVVLGHLRNVVGADPRPWMKLTKPFLRFAAYAGAFYFRSAIVFSTIVEDLPYPDNRVVPDARARGGIRFEYQFRDELRLRNQRFRELVSEALGKRRTVTLNGPNNLNWGHACGTCRAGDDPATSVLDRENRAHDVPNLFVVDASFFPSSGGTNPSLTIAANALRVAEAIDRQLP